MKKLLLICVAGMNLFSSIVMAAKSQAMELFVVSASNIHTITIAEAGSPTYPLPCRVSDTAPYQCTGIRFDEGSSIVGVFSKGNPTSLCQGTFKLNPGSNYLHVNGQTCTLSATS
jgi:hypothetical protein